MYRIRWSSWRAIEPSKRGFAFAGVERAEKEDKKHRHVPEPATRDDDEQTREAPRGGRMRRAHGFVGKRDCRKFANRERVAAEASAARRGPESGLRSASPAGRYLEEGLMAALMVVVTHEAHTAAPVSGGEA